MRTLEGTWWRIVAKVRTRLSAFRNQPVVMPGAVFNDKLGSPINNPEVMVPCNLAELVRSPEVKELVIIRRGELGDVIAAMAAARMLRKALTNLRSVVLVADSRFHEMLRCQTDIEVSERADHFKDADTLVVDFTSYFEIDHSDKGIRVSRVDRVLWTFGVEV